MDTLLKYKGIHPGIVLEREFKKRSLKQRPFAIAINEHPQTLNAITKGKRSLNTALALKIEEKMGLEEGILAILQTYYDIRIEKENSILKPLILLYCANHFFGIQLLTILIGKNNIKQLLKEYLNVVMKLRKVRLFVSMVNRK